MKCFFITPIGEKGSATRHCSDVVLEYIIRPVCNTAGMDVIRADMDIHGGSITDEIFSHLDSNELCIVDITGANPNVLFEAGYRVAKAKPVIFIRRENTPIPFDISGIQVLEYSTEIDAAETSKTVLERAIASKMKHFTGGELPAGLALTKRQKRLLDDLCEIYRKRVSEGMSDTGARKFGSTQSMMKMLPGYDFSDLDTYIRELADEGYVIEEHADIMVMFFELTAKAIKYAEQI